MFFGNLPVLALIFWFCAAFGIIPFVVFAENLLWIYIAVVVLIQLLYSVASKQNFFSAILFFPVQLLFLLHVTIKALITRKKKNYTWKGRTYYKNPYTM
jgi:hypothetical protein